MSSKKTLVSYVILLSVFTLTMMHSAELPNQQVLSNMPQQSVTQSVVDNGVTTAVSVVASAMACFVLWAILVIRDLTEVDVETYCPWKNAHFANRKREVLSLEEL